jgi:uncharacterized protein YgfB (UPF0149 family)
VRKESGCLWGIIHGRITGRITGGAVSVSWENVENVENSQNLAWRTEKKLKKM